jgi:hypothetical protein
VSQLAKATESETPKYDKSAFIDGAKDSKERLLINVLLIDNQSYAKGEVATLLKEWKSKEVKA